MTNTTEYSARVGIDWADRKHVYSLRPAGGSQVERGEFAATPEALEEFACRLKERFGGGPVAVALEQSRGPLLFQLCKYAHLVPYPVHPASLNSYRQAFYPSGAKSDPCDGDLILDLLEKHPERLRKWAPDTVPTRTLQFLVEARRDAVDDKTRYLNQLTAALKTYFPQMLEWLDVDSKLLSAMLERWPTLKQLKQAKPEEVEQWLTDQRYPAAKSQALGRRIAAAVEATADQAVTETGIFTVQRVTAQLKALRESIALMDRRISEVASQHEDYAVFASLPGAGRAMLPRLIAALGTQRDRFRSATDLQCLAGIAPVKNSSGNSEWVHWRWACSKFLRQTFVEWAALSMRKSSWARAFYDQQRAAAKSHHAALRALAFKWLRIIYRCWKDRCPYDETRYLEARATRANQPVTSAPASVQLSKKKQMEITWKNIHGLSKPVAVSC